MKMDIVIAKSGTKLPHLGDRYSSSTLSGALKGASRGVGSGRKMLIY
jgi:hypothetical protein